MSKKRTAILAALAAAGLAVTSATPAFATNQVNIGECNFSPNDYFAVHGDTIPPIPPIWQCYANAGDLNIDTERVFGFNSGNNAGWFEYEPGDGWKYRHTFGKFERIDRWYGYVSHLHID